MKRKRVWDVGKEFENRSRVFSIRESTGDTVVEGTVRLCVPKVAQLKQVLQNAKN